MIRTIILVATMLLCMTSCSNEQKALDFVSKKVVPEEQIENELIKNLAKDFGNSFKTSFDEYFNIQHEYRFGDYITISEEYRHKEPNYMDGGFFKNREKYSDKSENIINLICEDGLKYMNEIFERGDNLDSITVKPLSGKQLFNKLASLAVEKNYAQVFLEMYSDGIVHVNPDKYRNEGTGSINYFLYSQELYYGQNSSNEENERIRNLEKKYEYDWTLAGEKKQREIIEYYAKWIIVAAKECVKPLNYKLIDKSCSTIGEDIFEVRYLLEPQLEMVFPVRKVGKTFVSDGYRIIGDILQDSDTKH